MSLTEYFQGLATSAFLRDVDRREREPVRLATTVGVGLIVGLVAASACMILVMVAYVFLIGRAGEGVQVLGRIALELKTPNPKDPGLGLFALVMAAAIDSGFMVAFVALAAGLAHRSLQAYVTVARAVRWRLLGAGLGFSGILLGGFILVDRLATGGHQALPILTTTSGVLGQFAYFLGSLLLVPAAAAEELFFRGWLLRLTAAFTRNPLVVLGLQALIFAAMHFEFTPDAMITLTLMGLSLGYMTLRLGGIELAAGIHAMNNIAIVLLVSPAVPHGSPTVTIGALLSNLLLVAGYVAMTEAVARWEPLRRLTGVTRDDLSGRPPEVWNEVF